MGKVLAITSGKGGVGKTTMTANIGASLAGMGQRVLLIDGDTGLRNLDMILGNNNEVVYNYLDIIAGHCDISSAILPYRLQPRLYILPAPQLHDGMVPIQPQDMVELCQKLRPMFTFILIDCPAGIGRGFDNAIAGADGALVVTNPFHTAVRDADRVIGLLEQAGFAEIMLIINRIRMDMIKGGHMLAIDSIIDLLGIDTLGLVPEDDYVLASSMYGNITALQSEGLGREAFLNIARRLCGEVVPIIDFKQKGFKKRWRKLLIGE